MKPRRVLVALMAMLLVIPAATAYGADQQVNVRVLPDNSLAIYLDEWADLGGLVPGQTGHRDFWLNILNTTGFGWQVSVTGTGLESGDWTDCGWGGCWGWVPDGKLTIPDENLLLAGGDSNKWDSVDPVVDAILTYSVHPGTIGQPILQGTAAAWGEIGLDEPKPYLELTIPYDDPLTLDVDESGMGMQFHTVLTYTMMQWTP